MQQSKTLDYVFQKTIGEGTFAKVKLAIHAPTKQLVAIKILNKTKITDNSDIQRVHREMHILKLVRHPNIIQLYETIQITKQLFFVMEYCENGELFKYIVDQGKLKQSQACRLFEQLISGLEYLHKLHITHRDLKTQNLLLDHNMNLKIVDFGLANTYSKEETLRTPCGSQVYAAPQILQGQSYNGDMVDIWSSGIILFAMVCGYLPFQDQNPVQLTKKILHGKYNLSSSVSPQLKDLLQKILNKNPSKRYTIQKIRSHSWMNKNKGIIVGYNRIPIDPLILKQMGKQFNPQYVSKCLEANRHNKQTTTYYLTMKKFIKQGGNSACDLSNINFHPNPLKSSKSKQKIKKQVSILEQNKQNIPFNNQKIQVQFNRKSISKKTSLNINLNQSKLQGVVFAKDSSTTTTHKLIKPSKLSRLNESIISKGSKKQITVQKSQRYSLQRMPLNKKYVSTKLEKRPKKSQSQQKNKSILINQTFVHHKRQQSTGQIKKKLNESLVNRPSLNPKKKKVL